MLDNENIREPILDDSFQINIASTPTTWHVKHSCLCCGPFVEVSIPNSRRKRYFLRGWEFHPQMPTLIVSFILYTTITYYLCVFPHQSQIAQIVHPIFLSILLVFSVWSYFACVCMDPGYLPFNWIQTKRTKYTWEEQLSGLAVTDGQFNFAMLKENRPPKCSFSHSAGRFVIRGDHICGWAANWIGKRNHKQFILMNLYSGLFALTLAMGPLFVEKFFKLHLKFLIPVIISLLIEIPYALYVFFALATTLVDFAKDRTKLHRMKENKNTQLNEVRKKSFLQSLQEVCGNGSYWCWMIPIPAFGDLLEIDDNPDEEFQPFDEFVLRRGDFLPSRMHISNF